MSIKTSLFTQNLARAFNNDFVTNDYYIFGSDYDLSSVSVNSNNSKMSFLEKALFGKNIPATDFSYMIQDIAWQNNTVYTQYDDNDVIANKNFYVISSPSSQEGGDYHIFKCIFNNYGSASTERPSFSSMLFADNSNYILADGYIWKHVSTMPNQLVEKFNTRGYVPVVRNQQIETKSTDGIDVILVSNIEENTGYDRKFGITTFDIVENTVILSPNPDQETLQSVPGFYNGRALYIQKSVGSDEIGSKQYQIINSGRNASGAYFVTISGYDASDFSIEATDIFEILPRIEIVGTGSGASAIAIMDATNTKIVGVRMLTSGEGYLSASATVSTPVNFNETVGDIECVLRPIISPDGGHGSDIIEELQISHICFSTDFSSNNTDILPESNSYSKVGIVRNPTITNTPNIFDNRVKLEMETTVNMVLGTSVRQTNGVVGIIHEIQGNDVYIMNYNGPYSVIFDDNLALKTETSGDYSINNIIHSTYTQRSGDVLYFTDFDPITRNETSVEKIKILIDF